MQASIIKRIKSIIGLTLFLVLILILLVYSISNYKLKRKHHFSSNYSLTIPADPAALSRGRHLATSIGNCTNCHGEDFGGKVYLDAGALGIITGPNLTTGKGGMGGRLTDEDWLKAICYGVHRDGTSLLVMPSDIYTSFTQEDVTALIAYMKQLPPVDRTVPTTELRFLGRALLAIGQLPILSAEKIPNNTLKTTITRDQSAQYGLYLATVSGCMSCHRKNLAGGPMQAPGAPPAPNLTPVAMKEYTQATFVKTMRTGIRPDGRQMHPIMPWQQIGQMSDEELQAIWQYLQSVPSQPLAKQ